MAREGYRIEDAAKRLSVSVHTVELWRRNDDVPAWIVAHVKTIEGIE
jgi:transposase